MVCSSSFSLLEMITCPFVSPCLTLSHSSSTTFLPYLESHILLSFFSFVSPISFDSPISSKVSIPFFLFSLSFCSHSWDYKSSLFSLSREIKIFLANGNLKIFLPLFLMSHPLKPYLTLAQQHSRPLHPTQSRPTGQQIYARRGVPTPRAHVHPAGTSHQILLPWFPEPHPARHSLYPLS